MDTISDSSKGGVVFKETTYDHVDDTTCITGDIFFFLSPLEVYALDGMASHFRYEGCTPSGLETSPVSFPQRVDAKYV